MAGLDSFILCLRLIAIGFCSGKFCVLYNFAFQCVPETD